jgi:hypothetical protein
MQWHQGMEVVVVRVRVSFHMGHLSTRFYIMVGGSDDRGRTGS